MMKSRKRDKLKRRIAETHFVRRGVALFIDFSLIWLISILLYTGLFFLLSLLSPEYKKPIEYMKKIISLKSEDEALSPLGEYILRKSEEEIEKTIAKAKKNLEEKELSPKEKQRLQEKIKEGEEKLNKIRERKLKSDTAKQAEKRLEEELGESAVHFVELEEKFKWVREILVGYVYFTLFFFFSGRTPGKRMLGLKVVKRDRKKLSFWEAFERTHGYAFSLSLLLVGFLQVLWDKKAITMHDKIAGTTVIRIKKVKKKRKLREKKAKKSKD